MRVCGPESEGGCIALCGDVYESGWVRLCGPECECVCVFVYQEFERVWLSVWVCVRGYNVSLGGCVGV